MSEKEAIKCVLSFSIWKSGRQIEKTIENTEKSNLKPTLKQKPKSKRTYPLSPQILKVAAFCKRKNNTLSQQQQQTYLGIDN